MNKRLAKINVLISAALMLLGSAHAEARMSLSGEVELSYVNYDAKDENPLTGVQNRFSGETFAQKYSLDFNTTNLYHRSQQQYYDFSVGYEWLDFDTKMTSGPVDSSIKGTLGKLRYNGDIGYNPANLPITLRMYANDAQPTGFNRSIDNLGLINNNLVTSIDGDVKNSRYGVAFTFDPNRAGSKSLRGLPRLSLDYRESFNKTNNGVYVYDNSLRELAVAGLSKDNNWLHYRSTIYEDNIDAHNNFNRQEVQLGLVDNSGKRLWSSLTNWIDVSADGQLTTKKAASGSSFEEYDLNFMAIATRRTWSARTFMNFNRMMTADSVDISQNKLTETAKIPLFVKGVYGAETDWYMNVSTESGVQTDYSRNSQKETSYANKVTLGGTTFMRSKFTFAPSLSMTSSKSFGGADVLELTAAAETRSTARFSNSLGLLARTSLRYKDDGLNLATSNTWDGTLNLRADYKPDSRFAYSLREDLSAGTQAPADHNIAHPGTESFLNSDSLASVAWSPNAAFTTSIEGLYRMHMNEYSYDETEEQLVHWLSYTREQTYCRVNTKFNQRGIASGNLWTFVNDGEFQYRPDRYNDLSLKYKYTKANENFVNSTDIEFVQKYSYNFYTRTGVLRNFATLGQEIGYTEKNDYSHNISTRYITLSGRYSPTERLSLYGFTKYQSDDPGSTAMLYNIGMNANFKLLSTSLDYSYAKRSSDNRLEKKFAATVRRTF